MKILKNRKKKKGFTLIELIIVIAIIGILALIIIPQVLGYTNKAKTSTDIADSRTLLSAIQAYNASQSDTTKQIDLTSANTNTISTLANYANDQTVNDAVAKIQSGDNALYTNGKISDLQNIISGKTPIGH